MSFLHGHPLVSEESDALAKQGARWIEVAIGNVVPPSPQLTSVHGLGVLLYILGLSFLVWVFFGFVNSHPLASVQCSNTVHFMLIIKLLIFNKNVISLILCKIIFLRYKLTCENGLICF